jgi:CRP-like cAMP-binding protein
MSGFTAVTFKAGEVLFAAGDAAHELFILQRGDIELLDGKSGQVFATLVAGESFGEQAVLAGGVRSATAVAKGDCACLTLTAAGLNAILKKESPISNLLFQALHLQLFMQNALSQAR